MTNEPRQARRMRRAMRALSAIALLAISHPAVAQEWVPFPEPERKRPARAIEPARQTDQPFLAPMDGWGGSAARPPEPRPGGPVGMPGRERDAMVREPLPPLDEKSRAVDRGELQPVMAADGTGLPFELWRGLDTAAVEGLFAALDIPPRSPALASLWRRLITADVTPPAGQDTNHRFAALRVEALTRSGLLADAGAALARMPAGADAGQGGDALVALLTARNEIALGRRDTACEAIRSAPQAASIPPALKADAILISGYCAVSGGNTAAAGLTADLAREHGITSSAGLTALDAIASGIKPDLREVKSVTSLDYRLILLAGGGDPATIVAKGTPAVVAGLALDPAADPELRVLAGEAALRLNAISAAELAALYRMLPAADDSGALLTSGGSPEGGSGHLRRAALLAAAESERTPFRKVRLIRAFLDDARRAGLYLPALEMMAGPAEAVAPVAEIGWFAESAVEIALAAGRYDRARAWVQFAASVDRGPDGESGPLGHWLALADIADPALTTSRGRSLASVEALALRGRFNSDLLHRLATVLDALDTHVPIPLWDAASRTPQPAGGHLPEQGVLSTLLDASRKKEFGRTVLLAMQTLGPMGAEGAHIIALGDSIRALKRAGLEPDARRLGFEVLFASWPRGVAH